MDEITVARAPGKVLWLGGYSVLERPNVGFVTAIDAHANAEVQTSREGNIMQMHIPDFGMDIKGRIDAKTGKLELNAPKELGLATKAAEIALGYIIAKGNSVGSVNLSTKNDKAFAYRVGNGGKKTTKSGMGSSSAITVAITGALLKAFGMDPFEKDAVHKLSQLSHSLATGKIGSGFDIAAATYGSIKYVKYSPSIIEKFPSDYVPEDIRKIVDSEWDYSIERTTIPDSFHTLMANFVGDAAITTSMVGGVKALKTENPDKYAEIIKWMNKYSLKAIDALERINDDPKDESAIEDFRTAFDENRRFTKMLGEKSNTQIEDDEATSLIEDSKRNGALVARLPGSGGRDSIVAFCRGSGESEKLGSYWKTDSRLEILDVGMKNGGLLLEQRVKHK